MIAEKNMQVEQALSSLNLTITRVQQIIDRMPPHSIERGVWQNGLSNLHDLRRVMEDQL
jgi:hypothetical protein